MLTAKPITKFQVGEVLFCKPRGFQSAVDTVDFETFEHNLFRDPQTDLIRVVVLQIRPRKGHETIYYVKKVPDGTVVHYDVNVPDLGCMQLKSEYSRLCEEVKRLTNRNNELLEQLEAERGLRQSIDDRCKIFTKILLRLRSLVEEETREIL